MVNARIRKVYISKKIPIFSFGDPGDLTYDYKIVEILQKILKNL